MSDQDKKDEQKPIDLSEAAKALGFADIADFEAFKAENARRAAEARERDVKEEIKKWEGEKRAPALLVEAEKLMMSEQAESSVVNLSEGSRTEELSLSEVVRRLVNASPTVDLADGEEKVTDEVITGEKPEGDAKDENEFANLSDEDKGEAYALFFEGGHTLKDALAKVKAKSEKS